MAWYNKGMQKTKDKVGLTRVAARKHPDPLAALRARFPMDAKKRKEMERQLKAAYIANRERDLEINREWEPLSFEVWEKYLD